MLINGFKLQLATFGFCPNLAFHATLLFEKFQQNSLGRGSNPLRNILQRRASNSNIKSKNLDQIIIQ